MNNPYLSHTSFVARAAAFGLAAGAILSFCGPVCAQSSTADTPSSTAGSPATGTTMDETADDVSSDSRKFLEKAAFSGMKEVQLSRLAVQRSTNPEVRSYAQMLVDHHQTANAQLATIANAKGVMIPLESAAASMRMGETDTGSTSGSSASSGTSSTATTNPSASSGSADTDRSTSSPAGGRMSPGSTASNSGAGGTYGTTSSSAAMSSDMHEEIQESVDKLSRKTAGEFDLAFVEMMIEDHEDAIDLFEKQAERTDDAELAAHAQQTLPKLRDHLARAEALQKQLEG